MFGYLSSVLRLKTNFVVELSSWTSTDKVTFFILASLPINYLTVSFVDL